MNPSFFELYKMPIIIIGCIILVIFCLLLFWKKIPQDKAAVVTGFRKRIITGKGGLVIPFFERIDVISLENISIPFTTQDVMDCEGVPITTSGTAVVKIRNEEEDIYRAVEQFDSATIQKTIETIKSTVTDILEGNLREIIATMSVEAIYKDRDMFSNKVEEVAKTVLGKMGLQIVVLNIKDIDDANGFLKALGARKIAEVKKNAVIAEAEAKKESDIKTSEAIKQGEAAKLLAQTEIAQAQKQKAVKEAEYRREQDQSKAIADAAYSIQQNITLKDVTSAQMDAEVLKQQRLKEVESEKVQIEIAKELKNIELAEKKAERKKAELRETVIEPALADKEKQIADAEAIKFKKIADAEAEAQAIKATGEAQAEAIRAKGFAEAQALEKKAEAYAKYNHAAMANMIIEKLPDLAEKIAAPISNIDKVIVMDGANGDGVTSMAGNVTKVLASTIDTVKEVTGFDITDILKGHTYDAKVNRNLNINGDISTEVAAQQVKTKSEID